ncbi:hypothetical protein PF010_g3647 [Phytophthora fragariae]|uniref:Uncharacterized protein n=1 Tax=Phytophthora fragariae TaxID=53985 RepID=A0A6G0SCB7_9STRA|nr:hypothetical protein PF010_g3647 [Phytophthora fragariae]KAE9249139.1 hypothetical protein PF004_g3520 [Phytophthora fragariae]KAE9355201.1 hypothetical protein PF008_g4182 [Phytophthora fragariae]
MNPEASSSSSDSSSDPASPSEAHKIRPKTPKNPKTNLSTRRELKRCIEKKFRLRYASLQQAYEQRLEVLANRVQEAVLQVHQDATVHCLQENALTSEYASARLGEIVHEVFYGERERYVKAMGDQIAWQASDLRESQQKLRVVQRRESDAQRQWKLAQRDVQALRHQLDVRVKELHEQKRREAELVTRCRAVLEERDAAKKEVEAMKYSVQALETLQQEHEALKERVQREGSEKQAARAEMERSVKDLQEAKNRLELEKQASEQEATHLKHLLSLSEGKTREVAQALQQLQREDYPSKVARLESELVHQQQMATHAEKDHEDLKKRYEEFGEQVEQYMNEQTQEKAGLVSKGEEQVKQLQAQLETVNGQAQDALKAKQSELTRAMDQLKFRQEALAKAEKKIVSLEERATALKAQQVDTKLRHEKQVGGLEKEIVQWRHALEKEQEKVDNLQNALSETKDKYERKIASLQEAMSRQSRQGAQEKELEARTRWQNEFVAKQDARIEELKEKYDTALENQQSELLKARQMSLETANAAAAKWEKAKLAQKEEEELERRRRAEDAAREKERKEEQRSLQMAQKRMQQEFDERERRLMERERALVEKEKREERRRQEEASKAATSPPASTTPSVVVLNMGSADDGESVNQRAPGNAVVRVGPLNRRQSGRVSERGQQEHVATEDTIPLAQHTAELQAKDAQAALRAEERVQKIMQEFQERKESEFRAAMVNVRKGIQKLEVALEDARADKKRVEEQLLSERKAFVTLKTEYDEAKDAKRTVVQRLEEANENLGRLRTVVRDLQAKNQSLDEQRKIAVAQKEESEATAANAQKTSDSLREQLARLTNAAAQLENSLDTSVESNEQSKKELLDRIAVLEHHVQVREQHFETEISAMEEENTRELRNVSSQYDTHLRKLQETIDAAQQGSTEQETKANQLESSVRELTAAKDSLQAMVEQMKRDSVKQRKDFADLSRMHKNLTETMNSRVQAANEAVEEEREKRVTAEMRALKAEKLVDRVQNERNKCLSSYRQSMQQLTREWKELRKDVSSEVSVSWVHLQKEVVLTGVEWRKRTDELLQGSDAAWRRKAKEDKQEWKKCIAQKDKEMDALLSSQRVNDQSKYDQIVERLEKKSQELEDLGTRLAAQVDLSSELRKTIQKFEEEQRVRVMEQTQLQEQLITAQATIQKETREKDRVSALLKTREAMCEEYKGFTASIAKVGGADFSVNLKSGVKADNEPAAWDPRQFSDNLGKLAARLQEAQTEAIHKAISEATISTKEGVSAPLVSELEAARNALKFLWCGSSPTDISEDEGHLPWYLRAARTVKKEREANEQMVSTLRREIEAKEAEKKEVFDSKVKWQEAHKLLRFEKDTVLREMELLRQTLQKRKEQELLELRAEYDVRIEQLKQRHDRVIMKSDQDYETAMNQLRDMLEAERRATTNAKNELIELKMDLERTEEELREAHQKLDKETDELREAASKWKRKAKLAIKNGGVGTSSKAAMHMSSSSHGTEEDSDASYRMMYPQSRRASNAMADLSSLMEQSLVSIRKEALVPHTPRLRR